MGSSWARVHKNGRLEQERVTPIEAHSPVKIIELKIEHPFTCLATMPYVCSMSSMCTIFSTGGKFWLVLNFTELHALTLATHSWVTDPSLEALKSRSQASTYLCYKDWEQRY